MKTYSGEHEDRAKMQSKAAKIQWVICLSMAGLMGCSNKPARIKPPSIDPKSAASQAFELFDTDSSGSIDKGELAASPGLKAILAKVDTDSNGEISQEELQNRLQTLADSKAGVLPAMITVTMNGRPLAGVRVVLEPEPFLADAISPAEGETNLYGTVAPMSATTRGGMQLGIYRIRVTKSDNSIPAKYNSETTLGAEITSASPAVSTTAGLILEL